MMGKRERIASVDNAWLRMDRPTNLMMIVGVMMFDAPLDFERLKRIVAARFCRFRRFRQKTVIEPSGTWWEDDDEFDIDAHVKRAALPGRAGKEELESLVADLVSSPLDANRPLWQFILVEHYDGGSAIVVRIHHCIADGIALIGVLLSMTEESPHAPEPLPAGDFPRAAPEIEDFWQQLFEPMTEAAETAIKFSGSFWEKYWAAVFNPQQAFDYARKGAGMAAELAELALMPDDSPTRFKGKPGLAKRVAWSEPMPLAEIKAVCKALECSVNDILLSCVAGALRGYLADAGDPTDNVEVRALVPVNLRAADEAQELGNRFGLVALVLPVGIENPLKRLYEVKRRMEALKQSYQAAVTLGLLQVVGMLPKLVQQQVLDTLAHKATAVMTNVPGPQKPLYLDGARLAQQMFWVPQSGDIGMGVSILSYAGSVQFGLISDRRLLPDPERVVIRFRPEFEKILYSVLLEPWGEPLPESPGIQPAQPPGEPVSENPQPAARPGKRRVPKRFR